MENFNFNTGDQEDTEDKKSRWEVEDDEEEDSSSSNSKESLLFGKTEKETTEEAEEAEAEEKKSLFDISQEGLFSGLLDDIEEVEDTDGSGSNITDDPSLATADSNAVEEEFAQVVEDKLEEADSAVTENPIEEYQQTETTAYLEGVEDLVNEGVKPEVAIDQAAQESLDKIEDGIVETSVAGGVPEAPIAEVPELYMPPGEKEPVLESTPDVTEEVLEIENEIEEIEENIAGITDELEEMSTEEEIQEDTDELASSTIATSATSTRTALPPSPTPPVQPPSPPTPPSPLTPIPPTIPGQQPPSPGSPNTAPIANLNLTPESPDVSKMNEMYYRDRSRGNLLLGGALGYLFGRRRGRIKTEEKLKPEIDEQEKEIDELKKSLDESELEVKKHAREVIEKEAEVSSAEEQQVAFQERLKDLEENIVEPEDVFKGNEDTSEEKELAVQEKITLEQELQKKQERQHPLDVPEEKVPTKSAEKLAKDDQIDDTVQEFSFEPEEEGKFKPPIGLERSQEVKRDARTLRMSELLEIADDIVLENISLKDLYFNKRIDAINLRRVIGEYLRGEDYEKLLVRSLESEEIAVERKAEEKFEKLDAASPNDLQAQPSQKSHSGLNMNYIDTSHQSVGNTLQEVNLDGTPQVEEIVKDVTEDKPEFLISNNVAIAIGVIAGIVLVLSVIIFSR